MANKIVARVATAIRVGRFLQAKGFGVCNEDGFEIKHLHERDHIGILFLDPNKPGKTYLFGLIKTKPRRKVVGHIDLCEPGAAMRATWELKIHGTEYVEIVSQLARELAEEFHVEIFPELVGEQATDESFDSDYAFSF